MCGLAAGEVAEQTQRGLSSSPTGPVRGFLALRLAPVLWQMDPLAARSAWTWKWGLQFAYRRPGQPWDVGVTQPDAVVLVILS